MLTATERKELSIADQEVVMFQRDQQIQLWVDAGWPEHKIANSCHSAWKLGKAEVREILKKLRQENKQALDVERDEYVAQQMVRLESLATRAIEEGNLAVALGAYKELHNLAGLNK